MCDIVMNEKMIDLYRCGGIHKWVYFCMNYPYDFISKCWSDEPNLVSHLEEKFADYDYDMNRFYCGLDMFNMRKLLFWVIENYDSESKHVFGGI